MIADVEGLVCHPNGQVTLSGPLLRLERALDSMLVGWAADFDAVEHSFPPVIAARDLDRVDYFRSFPHLATFPAALSEDDRQLGAFAGSRPVGDDGTVCLGALAPVREVLTPAACYPAYVHFAHTHLETPVYLTTRATCFRREARYEPLARQWAFSMREIVCIGTREEVLGFLDHYRSRVVAFAAALELSVRLEHAFDPFFDPVRDPSALRQRLAPQKHEMVYDKRLALGSVNFHRRYFGEAFDIHRGERAAFSACVAFGLERWIFAFLERFGANGGWPDLSRFAEGA